jgi:hypothetical protein
MEVRSQKTGAGINTQNFWNEESWIAVVASIYSSLRDPF